jgi:hypothetical protein
VLPVRRFRQLALIVTAFTVAHSITLFAAAFGHIPQALWFRRWSKRSCRVDRLHGAREHRHQPRAQTDATGDAAPH